MDSPGKSNEQENRSTKRRSFIRNCSAIVAGSSLIGTVLSDTTRASSGIDKLSYVQSETIGGSSSDNVAVEGCSVVTGPSKVQDTIGRVNIGVAFPISIGSSNPTLSVNPTIEIEPVSTPGEYDIENVSTLSQSNSSDAPNVVGYGVDAIWTATVNRVLPLPSPFSYGPSTGDNISIGFSADELTVEHGGSGHGGMALKTELDFYVDDQTGTYPTGLWVFDVTCSTDASTYNTGIYDPGRHKIGEMEMTHQIEIMAV